MSAAFFGGPLGQQLSRAVVCVDSGNDIKSWQPQRQRHMVPEMQSPEEGERVENDSDVNSLRTFYKATVRRSSFLSTCSSGSSLRSIQKNFMPVRAHLEGATSEEIQHVVESVRLVKNFPKPGLDFKDLSVLLGQPKAFQTVINSLIHRYESRGITGVNQKNFYESAHRRNSAFQYKFKSSCSKHLF